MNLNSMASLVDMTSAGNLEPQYLAKTGEYP